MSDQVSRSLRLYSAVLLGDRANGTQALFTVPQGHAILRLGTVSGTTPKYQQVHSSYTTNLQRAGEFGNSLGNVSLRAMRFRVERGFESKVEGLKATSVVRVGGKLVAECNDVFDMLSGRWEPVRAEVGYTDCFDALITVHHVFRISKPTLLWLEFDIVAFPVTP